MFKNFQNLSIILRIKFKTFPIAYLVLYDLDPAYILTSFPTHIKLSLDLGKFALAVPISWDVAPQMIHSIPVIHSIPSFRSLFSSYCDQEAFPDHHCHFLFSYSDLLSLEHLFFYTSIFIDLFTCS